MKTLIRIVAMTLFLTAVAAFPQTNAIVDNHGQMGQVIITNSTVNGIPVGTPSAGHLTCGPLQHVWHWSGACGPSACGEDGSCLAICMPPPPDRCEDDMHEVTEKEWRELMKRLGELEKSDKE